MIRQPSDEVSQKKMAAVSQKKTLADRDCEIYIRDQNQSS